jgi:hypothetical protein
MMILSISRCDLIFHSSNSILNQTELWYIRMDKIVITCYKMLRIESRYLSWLSFSLRVTIMMKTSHCSQNENWNSVQSSIRHQNHILRWKISDFWNILFITIQIYHSIVDWTQNCKWNLSFSWKSIISIQKIIFAIFWEDVEGNFASKMSFMLTFSCFLKHNILLTRLSEKDKCDFRWVSSFCHMLMLNSENKTRMQTLLKNLICLFI